MMLLLSSACGGATQTADVRPATAAQPSQATTPVPSSPASVPTNPPESIPDRTVLSDLPHQRVDYWVERFSRGDRQPEIAKSFARMPEHEALIRAALRERNMPEDLLYLVMAESGFNTAAHSAADARGIWQLVPDTARRYGLRVDETVDERVDPAKATTAALQYLDKLYERFGSWYLAAAGYNAGENRVARLLLELNGDDRGSDADYYRIWDKLPGETRDYIPAMVALRKIGSDRSRYGF